MSRTWANGGPPFLNADNLNALEADVTTALGVPDAALAARVVAGATATALNATYATGSTEGGLTLNARQINRDVNVESVRLLSDTDDQAIQRAINIVKASGRTKRKIVVPNQSLLTASIDPGGLNGVTFEFGNDDALITATSAIGAAFRANSACSDLTFRGMHVEGLGIDDATGPRRSRTWSGPSLGTSVFMRGDLAPLTKLYAAASSGATSLSLTKTLAPGNYWLNGAPITTTGISGSSAPFTATLSVPLAASHALGEFVTVPYQIRNIRMENSVLKNILYGSDPTLPDLPVFFAGIRGDVEYINTHLTNTMDSGQVFNEHIKIDRYTSIRSADNGISLSRGNQRVTASNIDISDCAYHAVWIAGFDDDLGPQNITLSKVNARNFGKAGIWADAAPAYADITNFVLDGNYNRGPSDGPSDADCVGIFVGGYPARPAAPTSRATGFNIHGGLIKRTSRAGVLANGVQTLHIADVVAMDIGTQYLADGVTAISAADLTQNIGFLVDNATTSIDVVINDSHTIDTRATPYTNWAIAPVGSSFVDVGPGNTMKGCRNANNIVETGATRNINAGTVFLSNSKHTAGATAGSNAGTGTIPGFDTNGAAGSSRFMRWFTAGILRWSAGADPTAESGSNVGTDWVLSSFTDAGAALATLIRATRKGALTLGVQGQSVTFNSKVISNATPLASVTAGAQAASAAIASNGANDYAGTLNATAVASPAAGTLIVATWGNAFPATPHMGSVTPMNIASVQCQPYISARSTTGFTISCATAPASGASLQFDYSVVG